MTEYRLTREQVLEDQRRRKGEQSVLCGSQQSNQGSGEVIHRAQQILDWVMGK